MTGRLGRAALALGLAQLIGCAQGYDSSLDEEPPIAGGYAGGSSAGAGRGGTTGQAGRTGAGTGAAGMMYTGEPCERGETEKCMCAGDQGEGIRSCRKDDLSPTMGTFSPCEACVPNEEPAGMGGNGSGGSGSSSGRSGAGGSAGRAGSGSGSAGSSSGSAGRSGSAGSGSGNNDPAWCLFVPVPLPGVCD